MFQNLKYISGRKHHELLFLHKCILQHLFFMKVIRVTKAVFWCSKLVVGEMKNQ